MFTSCYFPHVLYGLALTSVSINLVGHLKKMEEDRAHIDAQFSILESIKEQLQQNADKQMPVEELQRPWKLALVSRPKIPLGSSLKDKIGAEIGWGSIFQGKRSDVSKGEKISHWDQKNLDALGKDMEK